MPRMIADQRSYVNDRLYEKGEQFDYDGPEGRGFHIVGGEPLPKLDLDKALNDQGKKGRGESAKAKK